MERKEKVFGTPLAVAGGASGWFRGARAAALLPGVVGAGQSRTRRRCFACSHPSQQGYTGMEGAEINRS